jgi:hypothetical protein
MLSLTYQQKQAEPQEQPSLSQDSWPLRTLQGPGNLGDASLDEIPGSRRGKRPIPKALAPGWESVEVLSRKKSVQSLSHGLLGTGQRTEQQPRHGNANQIIQIIV